ARFWPLRPRSLCVGFWASEHVYVKRGQVQLKNQHQSKKTESTFPDDRLSAKNGVWRKSSRYVAQFFYLNMR
ncbi:MAG: hypothetical protein ABF591_08505, partial [Lacticaseibacillus paracasei]